MKYEKYRPNEVFGVVGAHDVTEQRPRDGERGAFKFRNRQHTPYNKRRGTVESEAVLTICDEAEGTNIDAKSNTISAAKGWTTISLTETTQGDGGRVQSRTISVTIHSEARAALLAYLSAEGGR